MVQKGGKSKSESWRDWYSGQSETLLKELHLLTRDGQLNQDSRRKLKQVEHLIQLLRPFLKDGDTVTDIGAGKSYLGLLLYDVVLRQFETAKVVGIERRPELVLRSREIAKASQFSRAEFRESDAKTHLQTLLTAEQAGPNLPAVDPILSRDVVVALHACDTATDDAIALGVLSGARVIAVVPCCQAEVAAILKSGKLTEESLVRSDSLGSLYRHPLHRREFGSHLTNVIRALVLESCGYKVTVTELVGFEHSMKNELIVAERKQGVDRNRSAARLRALLAEFGIGFETMVLGQWLSQSKHFQWGVQ